MSTAVVGRGVDDGGQDGFTGTFAPSGFDILVGPVEATGHREAADVPTRESPSVVTGTNNDASVSEGEAAGQNDCFCGGIAA